MYELLTDQQLIDRLYANLQNDRRARHRGDAASISQYQSRISKILDELEGRGFCKMQCLQDCE